jgi:hypothetical protein
MITAAYIAAALVVAGCGLMLWVLCAVASAADEAAEKLEGD